MNEFQYCVGATFPFYGVDGHCFKIGGFVFEAMEDEVFGEQRSHLGEVVFAADRNQLLFFSQPLALVTVRLVTGEYWPNITTQDTTGEFYELVGEDEHVWVRFGTLYADECYPDFRFEYHPKCQFLAM